MNPDVIVQPIGGDVVEVYFKDNYIGLIGQWTLMDEDEKKEEINKLIKRSKNESKS